MKYLDADPTSSNIELMILLYLDTEFVNITQNVLIDITYNLCFTLLTKYVKYHT